MGDRLVQLTHREGWYVVSGLGELLGFSNRIVQILVEFGEDVGDLLPLCAFSAILPGHVDNESLPSACFDARYVFEVLEALEDIGDLLSSALPFVLAQLLLY